MADQSGFRRRRDDASPASRIALKVSELQADLLGTLHEEIGTNGDHFALAAQRLAGEFGSVTAEAVEAAQGAGGRPGDVRRPNSGEGPANVTQAPTNGSAASVRSR